MVLGNKFIFYLQRCWWHGSVVMDSRIQTTQTREIIVSHSHTVRVPYLIHVFYGEYGEYVVIVSTDSEPILP
jgi:hypothetical protein